MTPGLFVLLVFVGAAVGALSGFFGIGGGAFFVPFLVRSCGLAWDQAIALSLAQMVPTGALGAWRRWRQGESHARLALISLGGSIPGAWLGRTIVRALGERGTVEIAGLTLNLMDTALSLLFSAFLIWMGTGMWRTAAVAPRGGAGGATGGGSASGAVNGGAGTAGASISAGDRMEETWPFPPFEAWLLGLGVGTTSALVGIGGGFLFVPVAVQRFGLPVSLAVGASLLQIPVTAAVGAALYLSVPGTPYLWLVPLLLGSSVGVVQGVALSRRFDNQQLKRILAAMLVTVALVVLVTWYRGIGSA